MIIAFIVRTLREGNQSVDFVVILGAFFDHEILIHIAPTLGFKDILTADAT